VTSTEAPFRADHVGSLLRPAALKALRVEREAGRVTPEALAAAEDAAIRDAVRLQEEAGLRGITDGEQRRTSWHVDFLLQLGGWSTRGQTITARVTRPKPIFVEAFKFLKSVVSHRMPKLTIPSPNMLYSQIGRAGIDPRVYPDLDAFVEDTAAAYRAEIADLYAAGCRYLQLDDVSLAYLCDEELRGQLKARGDDPDAALALSVKMIRATLRNKPADMAICTHLCRGNFRSAWRAQGSYARIAETIFTQMPYDGFFLEFDDAHSGDFWPLRHVPKHVRVVLGLVTSKVGALEKKDELHRRLDEASKYVPMGQLGISPQCGFSSTVEGNELTVEAQKAKLALCVAVAREVWGAV
jgi:5-methyltetrahydropteroyltriglutamate--homocysteine methyltransferase